MHLLIPMAATASPACRQAMPGLQLPRLAQLLTRLQAGALDRCDAASLSPPHERTLARAMGLPVVDGLIPFAALAARRAGLDHAARPQAWAFVTPCHWQLGQSQVTMDPPSQLALTEAESAALLEAMRPYFEEDGMHLLPWRTGTWLAGASLFADLPCASLDRVTGRDVGDWLPRSDSARPLRRLQNEMQMLLYTHAVNDAREQRRQQVVNSFWTSGCGVLPAGYAAPEPGLVEDRSLCEAALADDANAWVEAWHRLDAGPIDQLLKQAVAGMPVTLSLAGDCACASWHTPRPGAWAGLRKLIGRWRAARVQPILESL